jgi:hypothetical protein
MQNELRDKLESAALLLDDYLDRVATPGSSDGIVLEAAREIAEAIELLSNITTNLQQQYAAHGS